MLTSLTYIPNMSHLRRGLHFLTYCYLLRIPLLTWIVLIALWAGSFHGSDAEPILRGIFDLALPQPTLLTTILRFGAVTLAALLVGTSMGVSARLVICNAHLRFRAVSVQLSPGLELLFRLVPLAAFIVVIWTALSRSTALVFGKVTGILLGAALWYILTIAVRDFFSAPRLSALIEHRVAAWIPHNEPGYLDGHTSTPTMQARHLFATYQLLLALSAYLVYGLASVLHIPYLGGRAPTLSLVLMLLTLICWGLSGIAFFLDRYRIPLLLPLALLTLSGGLFKQSDYYYQGLPLPAQAANALSAADVLAAHSNTPIVLVATTGGGIQAAGWTARVLAGLNDQVTIGSPGASANFSQYVRLISSVSGGSVGAMYFAAAYDNGAVSKTQDQCILDNAEASSLDEVAWGLSYPDLVFGLFPWLKDGKAIFMDRGRMLETTWRKRLPEAQRDATLSAWRQDAAAGLRPAMVFNSTLVESGDRYLLSSTNFTDSGYAQIGRWEFSQLYPESDLRVRTAARLSATFPYVTPASRMLRIDSDKSKDGRFYQPEPHAVDGGYYDNYGLVSLIDWLYNGLQTIPERPNIMIVEIRASPVAKVSRPHSSSYGTLFQLINPLETMANVRGTGQLSHNVLDQSLLNQIYSPNVCEAIFEFTETDDVGCPRNEPLNWHLTPEDIEALRVAWNSHAITANINRVQNFLQEGKCPP
jgi:patatin-like phospholipase